jgi:NTP pyrophosphatase (non-canonical NTP hydrolase)
MYMNDYQTAARRTAMGNSLDHFVHGLTEEAGEVAGVMKRFHRGDEKYKERLIGYDPVPLKQYVKWSLSTYAKDKLMAEIGDVLWYIAMIADELEITLEEVAKYNIDKLADRAARKAIKGEGDNR